MVLYALIDFEQLLQKYSRVDAGLGMRIPPVAQGCAECASQFCVKLLQHSAEGKAGLYSRSGVCHTWCPIHLVDSTPAALVQCHWLRRNFGRRP